MASTIVTKNSSTASAVPVTGDLTQGELAVNVTDKKLYTKDSGGTVVKLVGGLGNQEANAVAITGGSINGTTVGATTASTGAFTTLSASSTVSGTGFSTYLASPPAIGGTAAAAGSFTTLSASSTTTLSGGTANGVAYLNGSKVVTTGSALVFDGTNLGIGTSSPGAKLDIGGTNNTVFFKNSGATTGYALATVSNTGGVFQYGVSSSTGTFWGSGNAGNYSVNIGTTSAVNLGFGTGDTLRMLLDSSGNLGIGTSSPTGKLQVKGTVNFEATNSTNVWNLYTFTDNTLRWNYNGAGADELVLDSSGNLGLGVTPSAWGTTKAIQYPGGAIGGYTNGSNNNQSIMLGNAYFGAGGGVYINSDYASYYRQYSGTHAWFNAPSGTAGNAISFTQAMTLDASGNLLVGATSADARIFAYSSTGTSFKALNPSNVAQLLIGYNNTSYNYMDADNNIFRSGNGTERARIDSSGNLGLDVTNPGARLDVYSPSTTAATPIAYFGKALNSTATSNILVSFLINSGGTGSGNIVANGANQAAFATSSDARIKENISNIEPQLDKIMALRPVEFDYIESEGGGHQIGFIAQEMEDVYADSVGEREDGMKMISGWSRTEARLVKALQEMKAIIDEQAARIAALEAK